MRPWKLQKSCSKPTTRAQLNIQSGSPSLSLDETIDIEFEDEKACGTGGFDYLKGLAFEQTQEFFRRQNRDIEISKAWVFDVKIRRGDSWVHIQNMTAICSAEPGSLQMMVKVTPQDVAHLPLQVVSTDQQSLPLDRTLTVRVEAAQMANEFKNLEDLAFREAQGLIDRQHIPIQLKQTIDVFTVQLKAQDGHFTEITSLSDLFGQSDQVQMQVRVDWLSHFLTKSGVAEDSKELQECRGKTLDSLNTLSDDQLYQLAGGNVQASNALKAQLEHSRMTAWTPERLQSMVKNQQAMESLADGISKYCSTARTTHQQFSQGCRQAAVDGKNVLTDRSKVVDADKEHIPSKLPAAVDAEDCTKNVPETGVPRLPTNVEWNSLVKNSTNIGHALLLRQGKPPQKVNTSVCMEPYDADSLVGIHKSCEDGVYCTLIERCYDGTVTESCLQASDSKKTSVAGSLMTDGVCITPSASMTGWSADVKGASASDGDTTAKTIKKRRLASYSTKLSKMVLRGSFIILKNPNRATGKCGMVFSDMWFELILKLLNKTIEAVNAGKDVGDFNSRSEGPTEKDIWAEVVGLLELGTHLARQYGYGGVHEVWKTLCEDLKLEVNDSLKSKFEEAEAELSTALRHDHALLLHAKGSLHSDTKRGSGRGSDTYKSTQDENTKDFEDSQFRPVSQSRNVWFQVLLDHPELWVCLTHGDVEGIWEFMRPEYFRSVGIKSLSTSQERHLPALRKLVEKVWVQDNNFMGYADLEKASQITSEAATKKYFRPALPAMIEAAVEQHHQRAADASANHERAVDPPNRHPLANTARSRTPSPTRSPGKRVYMACDWNDMPDDEVQAWWGNPEMNDWC
eukprot:TRINITY_DN32002_c0_g2_i1.p1 TRINITY_DN32002_c0_g2~~TRINITY_DN32002_c0_g2_i1.p1  ORF type:complete len:853 (-),score=91.71 TRINITY_DN32002_c0_g2_i1:508-3066(-)